MFFPLIYLFIYLFIIIEQPIQISHSRLDCCLHFWWLIAAADAEKNIFWKKKQIRKRYDKNNICYSQLFSICRLSALLGLGLCLCLFMFAIAIFFLHVHSVCYKCTRTDIAQSFVRLKAKQTSTASFNPRWPKRKPNSVNTAYFHIISLSYNLLKSVQWHTQLYALYLLILVFVLRCEWKHIDPNEWNHRQIWYSTSSYLIAILNFKKAQK